MYRFRTFANLKLQTKFLLLFGIVFIIGTIAGGIILWQVSQDNAEAEYTNRGQLLMSMVKSVRTYTANNVNPLLKDKIESASKFPAEAVPAFSARTVFNNFRQYQQFAQFQYKEAAPNPTSPTDQADDVEAALVQRFVQEPKLSTVSGYRQINGTNYYYIAMPMKVDSTACLQCHTSPQESPASLVNSYGPKGGFGWQMGQVIAAQMLYVPAEDVFGQVIQHFIVFMAVFLVLFGVALSLIIMTLRRFVIQPVGMISTLSGKIAGDRIVQSDLQDPQLQEVSSHTDELGQLAHVFKDMANQVIERTENLKKQISQLSIEIDEIKKQKEVAEVTETDEFRDLAAKAQALRNQRKARTSTPSDPA